MSASILAVTSEVPWPLDTGGHLRSYHLLKALSSAFDVRLVSGVARGQQTLVSEASAAGLNVRPAWLAPRRAVTEGCRVLRSALRAQPYVLYGRHGRAEMREAIRSEIQRARPDLLYLDHLDSFQFADLAPEIPSVLDLHNVYSLLLHREAGDRRRNAVARRYLRRESRLLSQVEARAVRQARLVFSVSEQEQAHFSASGAGDVHVVPNGVACERYRSLPTGRADAPPVILFIGTLSWAPNAAAVQFLAEQVLPAVRTRIPEASLVIVGRDPAPAVRALERPGEVTVAANVRDIVPYLERAALLAVPLDAGGGTRLKILEAFAAGLPVVSTTVGAEGIAADHDRDLMIADRARFVDAVLALLSDRARGARLAERARVIARERYDWGTIGAGARRAIESILTVRSRR